MKGHVQSRRLIFVLTFIIGLLLGFVGATTVPAMGLTRLYEHWGPWGLLGRMAIALFALAIPVAYLVWVIEGAVQLAHSSEHKQAITEIHDLRRDGKIRRVLVPTGGGPKTQFGLRLANKIVRSDDGELTLLQVVQPSDNLDVEAEAQVLRQTAKKILGPGSPARTKVVANDSVVDAIVKETRDGQYDLLIVGASDESMVKRLLFGTIPEVVADQIGCPVLIVRD